ncbi:MAG: hypothetical protein EBT13_07170 [Rhodobacteraceae bacterium]|nr:hypothetical protein [Paracoccaceae bacterium]
MIDDNPTKSVQELSVFTGNRFICTNGVAEGDAISFADELVMDDIYQLLPNSERGNLTLIVNGEDQSFTVAAGSELGGAHRQVFLDCCATFMVPDGSTHECLILVEVEEGGVAEIYVLPIAPLAEKLDYRLVGIDRHAATSRFAEVACVSFTQGTHITMASGEQRPVEYLQVGDKVLTRDDGPQEIRWIGKSTLRAVGAFAPVVIRKGVLHNENDLRLSPDHRIFVYQRQDRLGAGRSEVLVKVRHLINGDKVYPEDGGFVDYYQLLFDDHQIIYAEGIAAESLLIDPRTRQAVPDDVSRKVSGNRVGHRHRAHLDYEVQESLMSMPDAAALLRLASTSQQDV